MLSDNAKRNISFGVFGFGIFAGLLACGVSAPAIFTIGANDTMPGILALLLGLDTPFWACVIALWYRKVAGWWLVLVGLYIPFGMYSEMFSVRGRHRPDESVSSYVLVCLILSTPLLSVGLFGILTERAGWPKLLRGDRRPND
jgi:hypothetical protein